MDDAALAVLALTNRLVDVGVPPLRASELWRLLDRVEDPATLRGRSADVLASEADLVPDDAVRIVRLLDSGMALATQLDALASEGIWTLTPFDEHYPSRLRDRLGPAAPPVLYGAGAATLVEHDGIGVVSSDDVDEAAAEVAREAARTAAHAGLAVVSGGGRGADDPAMSAALEAGGTAVGVLAEPLRRAIGKAATRRALLDGRLCLCTPYRPDAPFSAASAVGRTKVVYALCRLTLVVACAEGSGGTWAGATEALDRAYGAVAVWRGIGEGAGNAALEDRGARPVRALDEVLDLDPSDARRIPSPEPAEPEPAGPDGPDDPGQMSLLE